MSDLVAFARRDVTGVRGTGESVRVPKGAVLYDAWAPSKNTVEGVLLLDETGELARVRVARSAVELYADPLAAVKRSKEVRDGVGA